MAASRRRYVYGTVVLGIATLLLLLAWISDVPPRVLQPVLTHSDRRGDSRRLVFTDVSTRFAADVAAAASRHSDAYSRVQASTTRPLRRLSDRFVARAANDSDGLVVPNIVHFVLFGKPRVFSMQDYLGFLSVHKFIQPQFVFLHGDVIPTGDWWNRTRRDVDNVFHVYVPDRKTAYGKKFGYPSQHSNLLRLHIMLNVGGIYLDMDVMALKSFDDLRRYDFTLGRETSYSLNNGVMVGRRGAPFAQVWLETYRAPSFKPKNFGYESVRMANRLSELFGHLIHIEERSLARPNYMEEKLFYRDRYDWSGNYALHVMREWHAKLPKDLQSLKGYDCTVGEAMRLVYFGHPRLLSNKTFKGL